MTTTQHDAMDTATGEQKNHTATESGLPSRPAWEVIEDARRSRVTGELALTTSSPTKTKIYLDSGMVYFAERETDESLATRLVLAGAINPDQLHRGALHLNRVEHLGRLFDRDATIERDEVELALELITEQTLTEVAEQDVLSSHITMYRHHPSGVVRWFAAPHGDVPTESGHVEAGPTFVAPCPWEPPSSPAVTGPLRVERESNIFDIDPAQLNQPLPTLPAKPLAYTTRVIQPPVEEVNIEALNVKELNVDAAVQQVVEPVVQPTVAEVGTATPDNVPATLQPLTSIVPHKGFVPIVTPSVTSALSGPVITVTQMISSPVPVVTELTIGPDPEFLNGFSSGPITGPVSGPMPVVSVPLALPEARGLDSTPVPEDVATAVRRAITAIEAATQAPNGAASVRFGPMRVTSPGNPAAVSGARDQVSNGAMSDAALFGLTSLRGSTVNAIDTGEQPVQSVTSPLESIAPIAVVGALQGIQPSPIGPGSSAAAGPKAPLSEERKGALRRLIDGVRRR